MHVPWNDANSSAPWDIVKDANAWWAWQLSLLGRHFLVLSLREAEGQHLNGATGVTWGSTYLGGTALCQLLARFFHSIHRLLQSGNAKGSSSFFNCQ